MYPLLLKSNSESIVSMQPFDSAPEGEHDITEIQSHKFYAKEGQWWLTVKFESISKEYEDALDQVELGGLYADCETAVDGINETENFVVTYAKNLTPTATNKKFWTEVANLAGKKVEELFPQIKSSPKKTTTCGSVVFAAHEKCSRDHTDYTNYKLIDEDFHFRTTKSKWYGKTCRVESCSTVFGTGQGQQKPSPGNPVYVCEQYVLDKTDCAQMLCGACYAKDGGKTKRRGRGTN